LLEEFFVLVCQHPYTLLSSVVNTVLAAVGDAQRSECTREEVAQWAVSIKVTYHFLYTSSSWTAIIW